MVRIIILLLLWCGGAFAASCSNTSVGSFTCKQSVSQQNAASSTPTMAMPSNLTPGTIIVGGILWADTSATLNSITASSGCTGLSVTLYNNPTRGTIDSGAGFTIKGYSAGACTLQFNLSGSFASGTAAHEVSGSANTVGASGHNAAECAACATTTDANSAGNVTPTSGTAYFFGVTMDHSQAFGTANCAGTNYTLRESTASGDPSISTEDAALSGTHAVTFTNVAPAGCSTTRPGQYNMTIGIALDPAAAGAATMPPVIF